MLMEPQDLSTTVAVIVKATLSELGWTKDRPLKKVTLRNLPGNPRGHPERTRSLNRTIPSWRVIHLRFNLRPSQKLLRLLRFLRLSASQTTTISLISMEHKQLLCCEGWRIITSLTRTRSPRIVLENEAALCVDRPVPKFWISWLCSVG